MKSLRSTPKMVNLVITQSDLIGVYKNFLNLLMASSLNMVGVSIDFHLLRMV